MGFAWAPAAERQPGVLPETVPWPPLGAWPAAGIWTAADIWPAAGPGAAGRHATRRHVRARTGSGKPGRHVRPAR
jgi:hypothetical protein